MMFDISRRITPDALVYPGDPPVVIRPVSRIGNDSPYALTGLELTTHVLTHLDAPRHFFVNGAAVDELPPERFLSDALVVPVNGPVILPQQIPEAIHGLAVLFRTRHSGPWPREFDSSHVYLGAAAAARLVAGGANIVGIDYLSVDRAGDEDYPVHRTLLRAGVLILEGLDLAAVPPGRYTLMAFPLRLGGADGSPVRAVLRSLSQ